MVRIGEETGELSFMLENISNFFKKEVEEAVTILKSNGTSSYFFSRQL